MSGFDGLMFVLNLYRHQWEAIFVQKRNAMAESLYIPIQKALLWKLMHGNQIKFLFAIKLTRKTRGDYKNFHKCNLTIYIKDNTHTRTLHKDISHCIDFYYC